MLHVERELRLVALDVEVALAHGALRPVRNPVAGQDLRRQTRREARADEERPENDASHVSS